MPLHFVGRVVMTVDVAAVAGTGEERHVVAAGQQPDVVDLRNARQETLNGPRDKVLVISAAERVVERAVDLIGVEIAGGAAGGREALAAAALVDRLDERTDSPAISRPASASPAGPASSTPMPSCVSSTVRSWPA